MGCAASDTADHRARPDADTARLEHMRTRYPECDPLALAGVRPSLVPRHIAIIMDGNGRWARQRGLPRLAGHRVGTQRVEDITQAAAVLGVEALTLYSFSSENWRRPAAEVDGLMELAVEFCRVKGQWVKDQNVRVRILGRREGMPPATMQALDDLCDLTAGCTGITLCLAVNYGSRAEIVDAARALAERTLRGEITPHQIDEAMLAAHLYTRGLPEPDLLIRTAGELRLSNYLLWQLSYAELYVTRATWPEFDAGELHTAVRDFAGRRRTFGGLDDAAPTAR